MLLTLLSIKLLILYFVIIFIMILLRKSLYLFLNNHENFKDGVYNQKGWSYMPPESWKLPQPKLPICTGSLSKKSSSVATSGYPHSRMVWNKELSVVNNSYEKDINQYAPGVYIMNEPIKYPHFKSGI